MSARHGAAGTAAADRRRELVDRWSGAAERPSADAWRDGPQRDGSRPDRAAGDTAPLSYAQERLWFLEQLHPGQSLYVVPVVLRLSVPVSTPALRRALDEVVRRHEVLRSAFVMVADQPCQRLDPAAACPFRDVDLRPLAAAARTAAAGEELARDARTPFPLESPQRMRALLLTLAADDHVLVCTFHHTAFDGWSTTPFLRELTALYAAFARGDASPLPPLPIQYADYARWQRRALADPAYRGELLEYWTRRLRGRVVPEIAPDNERPAQPTYRAGRQTLRLPTAVVAGVRMLAQREGATPFMVLLAALSVLVQRYTAKDDVCVGTSVAGRSHAQLEPLVGCCLNFLALRTDLGGDPRVAELLRRIKETAVGAFAHQALPFELLLQEVLPTRDLARTPLFQVYVNYLNVGELDPVSPRPESAAAEPPPQRASGAPDAGEDTHSPFDLALYGRPAGDELDLSLVYAQDLFLPATAAQLLCDLRALLAHMAEHPDARISTLPLAPDAGGPPAPRRQVPAPPGWRAWPAAAGESSLGARFALVARQRPDRVAVRAGARAVGYGELAERVARLATTLRAAVRPGDRVALLLGHDDVMVAGVLGVLASGAAYVPLDPEHPLDRLRAIVRSARPTALLTDAAYRPLAERLRERDVAALPILRVEDAWRSAPAPDAAASEVPPDALAYLLYTSGSTGVPKGVMQSHRNVLRHVRAYADTLRLTPDDELTLLASYGFDASVMDLFGALLTGAGLLPLDVRRADGAGASAAVSGATILHATPTVYRYLLSLVADRDLLCVRALVLGGEAAVRGDVELFRRRFPGAAVLVNGLGPTESTLALQYVVDYATPLRGPGVPVGYPVAGTEVLLLNADRREVGVLAVGEIALRSAQVALGYWDDADATARAFPDGGAAHGVRTYLTGDLARRRRDGALEFVGRRDGQLKVRGVRVEPAEVERALAALPGVAAAAVAVAGEGPDAVLTAYVVCAGEAAPDAATLRQLLRLRLPDAMIPEAFVALARLPLNVNGKVDRAALPPPGADNALPRTGEVASPPATPMEEQVAALWRGVLGIGAFDRTASFFDLGGHSLLAMQVISRLRSTLRRAVPLRALFESPTLAAFSALVAQAPSVEEPPSGLNGAAAVRAARERYRVRLT